VDPPRLDGKADLGERPLLSVTNTGITAFITPDGETKDATAGFRTEVRIWSVGRMANRATFSIIFKRDMVSPKALAVRRRQVVDLILGNVSV